MIARTQNSSYEFDPARKQMRRLNGACDPTPRQGTDGAWKPYTAISEPIRVGEPIVIVWYLEGDVAKSTVTSPIVSIESLN